MAKTKWVIFILCLVGVVFIYEKFIRKPQTILPVKPPSAVGIKPEPKDLSSQTLGYVSVRMKSPLQRLVAGDTGSLEIDH